MKYLVNDSTDPHFNMAFDGFCLEKLGLDEPVFFLWRNRPSVIIGMNQSAFSEVNLDYLRDHGIVLARRTTGGGAVYHDLQNLNYTIVGRSGDLERDYPGYLSLVVDALRSLGVPAEVTGRNDILVDGRKCSGFAKRVYKDRLMVHGTLMYDVDFEKLTEALSVPGSKMEAAGVASVRSRVANLKEYLPGFPDIESFKGALAEKLAAGDAQVVLSEEQLAEIRKEADGKFRTWEWNVGRSPKADFHCGKKFSCGTVEASWTVKDGIVETLSFGGDFIGNLPADGLAKKIAGSRFDRACIEDLLSGLPVSDYFDGLAPGELAGLFF